MSGKFNGFSQDYIQKLKSNPKSNKENTKSNNSERPKSHPPTKPSIVHTQQQQIIVKPTKPVAAEDESDLELTNIHLQEALHFKPLPSKQHPVIVKEATKLETEINRAVPNESPVNSLPFKGVSLKDYENQRRMVEEQNKQKKEILYKAIEHHSERTAAEAKKLHEIKIELNKLESELAADVSLLRKQIEDASVKYMIAEKSYEQIETAFLAAKTNLFKARERKELLVEHLSIIISNNEDRKANKLSELMEKVGLTPLGERADITVEQEMEIGK